MSAELNAATPSSAHRGALATLRAEPAFSRLLLSGFISGLGDWFNTVALLGLALRLTGSPLAIGVTLALRTLPLLALAPLAGTLVDRAPRKVVLLATDLLAAGAALSFLLATSPARVWVLYAGTLALVILSSLRQPAEQAVTRMIVAPESLLAANGLAGMADGSVRLLGAALGGLVAGLLGPAPAFLINAASFLVSAALVASMRIPHLRAPTQTQGWRMLTEIWPIVRDSRPLRLLLALATLWPIGGGVVNILLTIYPTQVFHAGDQGIGAMYGAIGMGFLFGGWLAPHLAQRTTLALTVAFVVEGALQIAVSQAPTLPLAVIALALATSAAGVGNACSATILMRAAPENALGRVYALMGLFSSVTFGLSLLGASALLSLVTPRTLGALAGVVILCAGLMTLAMRSFARSPAAAMG
ncbi:MAG TPA: MFS transporter [Ktedonobacterales bacterium]|nr:MFS transporter [Ktedonobacterales bacterium]